MSAPPTEPPVQVHTHAGVAFATLHRPKALNTLNLEVIDLLRQQLGGWVSSPDVRVVVLHEPGGVEELTLAPLKGG